MRWIAVLVVFVIARAAVAAPPEVERAIAIGSEGIALYEQHRYADAYDRFAVADRMAHSVVFVLYMGRCKRNLGELIAARALFEQAAHAVLPATAPAPMTRARDEATSELTALAPRIPSVRVSVVGHGAAEARARIDGRAISTGTAIELDPGEHTIDATGDGAPAIARTVQLVEGSGLTTIELALRSPARARGTRLPAWIALGVGVAGVGVGSVTGVLALRTASDVDARCVAQHCFDHDRPDAERAERYATASTVSFVIGGAALAAGVALWLWPPGRRAAITAGPGGFAVVAQF